MSALDLLQTESQFGEAAPYVPTGFLDVLPTQLVAASYSMPNAAPRYERSQAYDEREKLIRERFGDDVVDESRDQVKNEYPLYSPTAFLKSYTDPDFMSREYQKSIDGLIEQGRQIEPDRWHGIKTNSEIDAEVEARARNAIDTAAEIASRAEMLPRIAGSLLGGFAGAMTDPINIATLPFGAGASRGILQAIGIDALLNAGIEAYQQPEVMRWQKELGYKYGIGDAIANVASAGAGAGIISGVARGTGPAVRAVGEALRIKSMPILERMAFSTILPSRVRDAAAYMSRIAHIDEEIPLGLKEAIEALRPPAREDGREAPPVRDYEVTATHRQNLQETQEAFRNYREPQIQTRLPESRRIEPIDISVSRISAPLEDKIALRVAAKEYYNAQLKGSMVIHPELGEIYFSRKGNDKTLSSSANSDILRAVPYLKEIVANGRIIEKSNDYKGRADIKQWFYLDSPVRIDGKDVQMRVRIFEDVNGKKYYDLQDVAEIKRVAVRIPSNKLGAPATETIITNPRQNVNLEAIEAPGAVRIGLSSPTTSLAVRPNDALRSMDADVKAAETSGMNAAFNADFERLLKEQPDLKVETEAGELTIREIADSTKEGENILSAIKTCAVGKK